MKAHIKKNIKSDTVIRSIMPLIKNKKVYLAGGYIRDAYFKKETPDRDIVVFDYDAKNLALDIADNLSGSFVELDCINKIYRVVLNKDYIDIAQGLNNSLEDDIKRRDFTINAIFYDLNTDEFIDLSGGFCDLADKKIKTSCIENLKDDPLRMLRAFRFKSFLGFAIDDNITRFIKLNAGNINYVAKERINTEIIKMFEGDYLPQILIDMYRSTLLEKIFPFILKVKKIPSNSHHHLDLLHHLIETVKNIRINNPYLKLAAFMHDIGKPDTWSIEKETGRHRFIGHDELGSDIVKPLLNDLKFSKKHTDYISKMIKYHIYPSALMANEPTKKAMARFVRKLAPHGRDVIELARADRLSARGPAISADKIAVNLENLNLLLKYYDEAEKSLNTLPKLLDGNEIMRLLNIKGSPLLGQIIDELKEAQLEGSVVSKDDAICFVRNYKQFVDKKECM